MEYLKLDEFEEPISNELLWHYSEIVSFCRELSIFLSKNKVDLKRLSKRSNSDIMKNIGGLYLILLKSLPTVSVLFKNPSNKNEGTFVPMILTYSRHRFNPLWMFINSIKIRASYDKAKDELFNEHRSSRLVEMFLYSEELNGGGVTSKDLVNRFKKFRETKFWTMAVKGGVFLMELYRDSSGSVNARMRILIGLRDQINESVFMEDLSKFWGRSSSIPKSELLGLAKKGKGYSIDVFKTEKGKWNIRLINQILVERGSAPEQLTPFGCLCNSSDDYGINYGME